MAPRPGRRKAFNPRGRLHRGTDWQSAVSRIGNPQAIESHFTAAAPVIASLPPNSPVGPALRRRPDFSAPASEAQRADRLPRFNFTISDFQYVSLLIFLISDLRLPTSGPPKRQGLLTTDAPDDTDGI